MLIKFIENLHNAFVVADSLRSTVNIYFSVANTSTIHQIQLYIYIISNTECSRIRYRHKDGNMVTRGDIHKQFVRIGRLISIHACDTKTSV